MEFRPTASLEVLRLRAKLLAFVRRFFDESGYWEVDTPILSHERVIDPNLEPFVTPWSAGEMLSLQTSPEFAMKRLLAAGAQAIYQLGKVMRRGELGRLHNPEFTMLEWYRVGDTHREQMDFVERFSTAFFREVQQSTVLQTSEGFARRQDFVGRIDNPAYGVAAGEAQAKSFGESLRGLSPPTRLHVPFERLTYDQAFERYTGMKVLARSTSEIVALARRLGVSAPESLPADDRDGWLNLLLAEKVDAHLGHDRPTFIFDFPDSQAALARVRCDGKVSVAERFELYVAGVEVCNGYHELTEAAELRARIHHAAIASGRHLPEPTRLLAAMERGLPACAGVALGFDRLLMLCLGADSVREVIPFAFDRA